MITQQGFGCAAAHERPRGGPQRFTPALPPRERLDLQAPRQRSAVSGRIECAWRTCA